MKCWSLYPYNKFGFSTPDLDRIEPDKGKCLVRIVIYKEMFIEVTEGC